MSEMNYRIIELKKDNLLGRSYTFYENDSPTYEARISWANKKATLVNLVTGNELEVVRLFTFLKMQFEFRENGSPCGQATKARSIFTSSVEVTTASDTYDIKGAFASKEFTILKNGTEIAKVSRVTGLFQPINYGIAVLATENVDLTLVFVLMIEMILKVKKSRRG